METFEFTKEHVGLKATWIGDGMYCIKGIIHDVIDNDNDPAPVIFQYDDDGYMQTTEFSCKGWEPDVAMRSLYLGHNISIEVKGEVQPVFINSSVDNVNGMIKTYMYETKKQAVQMYESNKNSNEYLQVAVPILRGAL